ncbi:hypothetical protein DLM_0508 [Aquitalea magnusonii]|jgi:hypothetical protein|uniref:Lipoprotein n=1 Tax=Aquitalea magnusonii TaxID=332411 RepID=A0A3G9GBQ9_9NEIS|nr:hypothetical protein [Aquitalea magnusonii]BBF84169.1 hypothetical protein DLM_0508 [Aquitalea magnusonii]
MSKFIAPILLLVACSSQVFATDTPAASQAAQQHAQRNANDAFCTAGTPCEVNRQRAGEHH